MGGAAVMALNGCFWHGCFWHCHFHAPWLVLPLCHSQFLYPCILRLVLAVVQGVTTIIWRSWKCCCCFVSAGYCLCFSYGTWGVLLCFHAHVAIKHKYPEWQVLVITQTVLGASVLLRKRRQAELPCRATEAMCCFSPRCHMLPQQGQGCFDWGRELPEETCGLVRSYCCK